MYTGKRNLTSGFKVNTQAPIDDRLVVADLVELANLTGDKAYKYYEGMLVWVISTRKFYEWKESADGIIVGGFTYPNPFIQWGIDYSNRTFNFLSTSYGTSEHVETITVGDTDIIHSLNTESIHVSCYESSGEQFFPDIKIIDENTVRFTSSIEFVDAKIIITK